MNSDSFRCGDTRNDMMEVNNLRSLNNAAA